MNRIFENTALTRLAASAVIAAGLLTTTAAHAHDRSAYIYNDGWDRIYSVHISHVDDGGWGSDLLGRYVIGVGDEFHVQPRNHQGYCRFDIRIEYESGDIVTRRGVDLCGGRQIVANEWSISVYYI